jgi:colanic acid biosynthesis glycosyl transferase WcaI
MNEPRRLILLNQMAGPLFRQLAEGLAPHYPDGGVLVTGHPDTLAMASQIEPKLMLHSAPGYNRCTHLMRIYSWFRYLFSITKYLVMARKGDVLLLVSNPPLLGLWVWLFSYIRPLRYAVLVYDIYPDVLVQAKILRVDGLPAKLWNRMNRLVYRRADSVITIGHRMAGRLQHQIESRSSFVSVVLPWADVESIKPMDRADNPHTLDFIEPDDFVILYSGNMGGSHDIDSMLVAAGLLQDKDNIRFLFIGNGEKLSEIELYIQQYPDGNVRLFPFQPEEMLPYTLTLADISLVALDEGFEELMVPSKVFSYIAAGSAVVAIANDNSELSDVMEKADIGLRVKAGDPKLLAEAILQLVENPQYLAACKENARKLALSCFSRERGVQEFYDVLQQQGLVQ